MKKKNEKRLGLVLGSGGGRGFAHLGVLKVLQENDIIPDYVIGSSVGALVGALFCKDKDYEKVQKVFIDLDWKEFSSLLCLSMGKGLLDGKKLRKQLDVFFEGNRFEDLDISLETVATDLFTAEQTYFNKGSLAEAVHASIAFPMFIEPLKKGNDIYWDGGLSDPLPVKRAKEKSEVVLAVNLDKYPEYPHNHAVSYRITMMAVKSLQHHLAIHSSKEADVLLELDFKKDDTLLDFSNFFKKDRANRIIKRGADMTEIKLDLIKEMIK